ncbi:RmlC-like cupin domain-containing protein [Aspergillus leporis]|uniref:RmlC-like cupin domain-containing protein n=1 Tax=Aspergillus leporis TaxID=41062 RepID=A0A5N5X1D1_9EURO|nr:RmlC-like cupin domain-containing protein [Aspergillus leporis]
MNTPRNIQKIFQAVEVIEGAGALVRRSIGSPRLRNFTPFIVFDHATVGPDAGFPEHPHRGQETITYCLSGSSDHEDFTGHRGTLTPGDLQFMTAGRGIMHAEMPRESSNGSPGIGIQIWIDLPKALKYVEPRYRYLSVSQVPRVEIDHGRVTVSVILGQSHGRESKRDLTYTPIWYLDIIIRPGGRVKQIVPTTWNTFAYVLEGTTTFHSEASSNQVKQYHTVIFDPEGTHIEASVPENGKISRFLLLSGEPLKQRIVHHGPFVCTSEEEIYQAISDFRNGKNGFERAIGWRSSITKPISS